MAPKVASGKAQSKKAADKKTWATTWHLKQVYELREQKASLVKAAKELAKQKRSIQQKHRRLKKKASSVNLEELMDLCMLKATVMQNKKIKKTPHLEVLPVLLLQQMPTFPKMERRQFP